MNPANSSTNSEVPKQVERFWKEWGKLGSWLLSQGKDIQYGNTLIEVKYQAGYPVVIVRTSSENKLYKSNISAKTAISKLLDDSEVNAFEGALTYTVVYHDGGITRIILDEYGSNVLK